MKNISIGITDDHQLFLKSLGYMIDSFKGFTIVAEAMNGKILIDKLSKMKDLPDIILLDVNMPVMDGAATAAYLTEKYPAIKLVALSMKDDDTTILQMIQAGVCAYLLKDIHPNELEKALHEIEEKGYYNADATNINYRKLLLKQKEEVEANITEREKEFLKLACSDFTYSNIAKQMGVSERSVDGYRETLFHKLNVQSRVGMALEAIRRNLVQL